jgi:hypothetical protein
MPRVVASKYRYSQWVFFLFGARGDGSQNVAYARPSHAMLLLSMAARVEPSTALIKLRLGSTSRGPTYVSNLLERLETLVLF